MAGSSATLQDHLKPFRDSPVSFEAPSRQSFFIFNFKTLKGALKLVSRHYKNRKFRVAEDLFNNALKNHGIGLYNDAERDYVKTIELQPDHEPARVNLAALYIRQNSHDLAEEQLKQAIQVRPRFHRAWYNLGLLHRFMERNDEAEKAFRQALKINKSHFLSYLALGELAVDDEAYEAAAELYREALKYTDTPDDVILRLVQIHFYKGDYVEVEELLKKILSERSNPDVLYNLAWILATRKKDLEESVRLFRDAERQRTDFSEALYNLAITQSMTGANSHSVKSMLRFVKRYGDNSAEQRIEHLKKLSQVNAANDEAWLEVARIYKEAKQPQKAIETLTSILQANSKCAAALDALGACYQDLGRHKDAIRTYSQMVKVAPQEVEGHLGLASAYGSIENYAAAVPVIEKVLKLDPNNTDIHYQYATLMAQDGELDVAYRHYRKVAALDPDFPRIQKRLKMLEEEIEDAEEVEPWPKKR